jgi:hypothetical protein
MKPNDDPQQMHKVGFGHSHGTVVAILTNRPVWNGSVPVWESSSWQALAGPMLPMSLALN